MKIASILAAKAHIRASLVVNTGISNVLSICIANNVSLDVDSLFQFRTSIVFFFACCFAEVRYMRGQHCPFSMHQILMENRPEVFKIARKNAAKFRQPARDPKHNQYRLKCSMDIPANRLRVARNKSWCRFLKCTVRYESHLVTISAKRFQTSPAKCPIFSCHFLPSMLCVPAPCEFFGRFRVRLVIPFGLRCPYRMAHGGGAQGTT